MNGVRDVLIANLDSAYDRRGWHGPVLRGALRGVSVENALWRAEDGRHNIWELTMHCAYWKYAVRRQLTGERRGSFGVKGSNWFPAPAGANERSWREVVAMLDDEHEKLRGAIESLPDRTFSDAKKTRMIYGVAAHDVYHTGQVQLIKRLQRS